MYDTSAKAAQPSASNMQMVERMQTDMEGVSERFGGALRRLRDMNGVLRQRLDSFKPEPAQLGANAGSGSAAPPISEPQPGTAASLVFLNNALQDELSVLDGLLVRVQAIL